MGGKSGRPLEPIFRVDVVVEYRDLIDHSAEF
jgi:hypothetical protein